MWDHCDYFVVSTVVNDAQSGERSIVLFVILCFFLIFYHATCSVLTSLVISSEVC
jgi:hypothetical protein